MKNILNTFNGVLKYILGWLVVFLVRLIPGRPPNVEPMMATIMPFSKQYGWIGAFVFAFFGIALFDAALNTVGLWTLITGSMYGAIAIASWAYFRNRKPTRRNYTIFAIGATLAYDIITGLSIGPLFFNQPFMSALVGQIPFTLWHLAGNIAFAYLLSPVIYRWVVKNESFDIAQRIFRPNK